MDPNTPAIQQPPVPVVPVQDLQTPQVVTQAPPPPMAPIDVPKPRRRVPLLAIILFLLAAAALGVMIVATNLLQQTVQKDQSNTDLPLLMPGKLVIGTDATFPPMEFLDDKNNYIGYDIELGSRIAQELGLTAEFKNIKWDDIFTALENNEVDVVISAVTITEERKGMYDFSQDYLNAGQVIVTRKDQNDITKTDDLNGKRIAVQKGTTNEDQAKQFTQQDLVFLKDDFIQATEALVAGEVDAIFTDLTNAKGIVSKYQELKIASEPFTSEFYGVVLRKDQTELKDKINSALDALRQQGVLVYLKQKWLE